MKKAFLIFILFAVNNLNAQVKELIGSINNTQNTIYRYSKSNGIVIDYSLQDEDFFLKKSYNYGYKNDYETTSLLNRDFYEKFDFFQLSEKKDLANVSYTDTIYFDKDFTFKDANFAIKNILNKYNKFKFSESKFGFYLVEIINRYSFLNDLRYILSISIREGYLILAVNFNHYLFNTWDSEYIPYNDKFFAFEFDNRNPTIPSFISRLAHKQLYTFATLSNSRKEIIEIFKKSILDVQSSKMKR